MKTVRFASLVEHGGRPKIHLAWSAPKNDSALQVALKQHRVVTVHQRLRGAKKDHGVVGLEPGQDAQFLIFPKSLGGFEDHRVVAIQYDLLDDALSLGPTPHGRKVGKHKAAAARPTNLVAFDAGTEKPAPVRAAAPPAAKAPPPPPPSEPVESDPVKFEIRKALAELAAGRTADVRRRLRALLD